MRCPHFFRYEPGSDCRECSEACKLGEAESREALYARIHREAGTAPERQRGEKRKN